MAANPKNSSFITMTRTNARDMTGQDGVSLAELQAIFTTLAAIDALMAAGHETNLEKGK